MINKEVLQSARKHEVESKLQDITQVEASQHFDFVDNLWLWF
jgi:hypothetical protein